MGKMNNAHKILIEKCEGKRPPKALGVDDRIILECILEKRGGMLRNGFIWLRIGTSGGFL
jgi:hypothetical protein